MIEDPHRLNPEEYGLLERIIEKNELIPVHFDDRKERILVSLRVRAALKIKKVNYKEASKYASIYGWMKFFNYYRKEFYFASDHGKNLFERNKLLYHNINKE